MLKDELKGTPIYEYIGLTAKMYSILAGYNVNGLETKYRAKGVKTGALVDGGESKAQRIDHQMFKDCLFEKKISFARSTLLRSCGHKIYTIEQCKKALSSYDDKRFVLENNIDTLPYGHCQIPQPNEEKNN